MKYSLIALLFFFGGYLIYPVLNPTLEPSIFPDEKKEKFENFMNHEAKEFAMLQDAEAKLKAAEAMYGKMVVLFLAELGLRAQYEFKPVVTKAPEPNVKKEVKEADEVVIKTAKATVPLNFPGSEEVKPKKEKAISKEQENWIKYSSTPFLDSFRDKERRLLGHFEGTLTHEVKPHTGRVDTIIMNFNLFHRGREIDGETSVIMIDPEGKEYSRNNGSGGNRSIKGVTDTPNSYYVEASPSSYFLINLSNFPQVSGKYFERGKFIGNVNLRKTGR